MYEKIAADTMMEKEPWRYNAYLKRLLQRVDDGGLSPINMHIFDGMEKGVAALQFLQRANNIGKVVISSPSRLLTGFRFNLRYSGPCSSAAIMIMMFYY
ncbi:eryA [Symbiodinium sp. KB8]|nr:eryA [Symbiodinium sp. KB8]